MKKLKQFIIVLLVAIMLTGCVKVDMNMKITKENVSITYVMGIEKQYASLSGEGENDIFADTKKDLNEQGFTVTDYTDDKYQGIKGTKSLGTLDDLSTKDEITDYDFDPTTKAVGKIFKIDDSNPKRIKYSAKLEVDAMNKIEEGMGEDTEEDPEEIKTGDEDEVLEAENDTSDQTKIDFDTTAITESMVATFTVELPSAPIKSNATSTNGTKLTWDLKTFKEDYIEFEFEIVEEEKGPVKPTEEKKTSNNDNTLLFVAIGGGLFLIIAIIVIIALSKKKKKESPVIYASQPIPEFTTPVAPTPVVPSDTPQITNAEENKNE